MSCCSSSRTVSPVSRAPTKNTANQQQQQQQQGQAAATIADNRKGGDHQPQKPQSIYEFTVKGHRGVPYDLRQHEGKPVLCMNVASKCTFTKTGYETATELFDKYKDKGFTVLAFPCNQFGSQEPDSDDEIKKFACKKYKAGFPIMSKCDVNGAKAEPLWEYMKNEQRGIFNSASIKWNFTSFLCDCNGKPIKRYSPGAKAAEIEADLLPLLAEMPNVAQPPPNTEGGEDKLAPVAQTSSDHAPIS